MLCHFFYLHHFLFDRKFLIIEIIQMIHFEFVAHIVPSSIFYQLISLQFNDIRSAHALIFAVIEHFASKNLIIYVLILGQW